MRPALSITPITNILINTRSVCFMIVKTMFFMQKFLMQYNSPHFISCMDSSGKKINGLSNRFITIDYTFEVTRNWRISRRAFERLSLLTVIAISRPLLTLCRKCTWCKKYYLHFSIRRRIKLQKRIFKILAIFRNCFHNFR
jgi:hypothetical protein